MIKNLFRGSMDIIYNNINYTRNTVNEHIRSFDAIENAAAGFSNSSGFWRTVLELLLGMYFIISTASALFIHIIVVLIAWPFSLVVNLFMLTVAGINEQSKYSNTTYVESTIQPNIETSKKSSKGKQNNENTIATN